MFVANNCFPLSVVVASGSRYEVNYPTGITHFLQKLAFGVKTLPRISRKLHASLCARVGLYSFRGFCIAGDLFLQSTSKFPTGEDIHTTVEKCGGICDCQASR